jgi:GT2 family glycosyltransferase
MKNNLRTSVSFVIPVRNDARRLEGCLRSIAENRYPRELVDVIVVDNTSTDGSDAVARSAGATVLRLSSGVAALRNAGAAAARGEILAFVDADHQLDAGWLATLARCMRQESVAAAGAPYTAPPQGTWVQRRYDGLRERLAGRHEVDWLASGNMAVRRQVFESLGGFDEGLETCEDVDLCQRIRDSGGLIVGDEGLKSIHLGDPATLRGLFLGELWRGRDNLRASLRGPRDIRHLRSVLVPILYLIALLATAIGAASFRSTGVVVALSSLAVSGVLSAVRTRHMVRRVQVGTFIDLLQAFAVAVVYDIARALALVVRVNHRTRRIAETPLHVQTN